MMGPMWPAATASGLIMASVRSMSRRLYQADLTELGWHMMRCERKVA
jgi:hypothetical protein